MEFQYNREEFLGRIEIQERLLIEIKRAFSEVQYIELSDEEIESLLTLKDSDYTLNFDIIHVLDNHVSQYAQDYYYQLAEKLKNIFGTFCYDYNNQYCFNHWDFPNY